MNITSTLQYPYESIFCPSSNIICKFHNLVILYLQTALAGHLTTPPYKLLL